jgi:hypothetical protein
MLHSPTPDVAIKRKIHAARLRQLGFKLRKLCHRSVRYKRLREECAKDGNMCQLLNRYGSPNGLVRVVQ